MPINFEDKIKSFSYNGYDDDGIIQNKSESGIEYNLIRYVDHKFTLEKQYLTFEELEYDIKRYIELKSNNQKETELPLASITEKGYIDFKEVKGQPQFYFDLSKVKPKKMTGNIYYSYTIELIERVVMI